MIWCAFAGFVLIMAASFARRSDKYQDLCIATLVMAFLLVLMPLAPIEGYLRPFTWDARLRAVDLYLGLDGFAWARICWRTPWLRYVLTACYEALPLAFAVSWTAERSCLAIRAAVIGGLLAFPLYLLVPACGPQYVFPGYPWHPRELSGLVFVSMLHPRNCFPSMHYAWALLLTINTRNKGLKGALFAYSILVGMATVGGGEHYVVDVIAAVPFVWLVQWMAEQSVKWRTETIGSPSRSFDCGPVSIPSPFVVSVTSHVTARAAMSTKGNTSTGAG
jgi:hypothetical protein